MDLTNELARHLIGIFFTPLICADPLTGLGVTYFASHLHEERHSQGVLLVLAEHAISELLNVLCVLEEVLLVLVRADATEDLQCSFRLDVVLLCNAACELHGGVRARSKRLLQLLVGSAFAGGEVVVDREPEGSDLAVLVGFKQDAVVAHGG